MEALALPIDLVLSWNFGALRDRAQLESALAAPHAEFGGNRAYRTAYERAAALLIHVIMNHPFTDGNKRTGWTCCRVYLAQRGIRIRASTHEVVSFVCRIVEEHSNHSEVTVWLIEHSERF